jgi:STE24 endopeptidase
LYQRSSLWISLLTQLAVFVLVFSLILSGYILKIDLFLRQYFQHEYLLGLFFFVIIGSLFQLVRNSFEAYQQLVIDKRFGFKRSVGLMLREFLLKALLALFLGSLAFWFLMFSFNWLETNFWASSWLLFGLIYLIYNYINQRLVNIVRNRNYSLLPENLRKPLLEKLKQHQINIETLVIRKNSLMKDTEPASIVGWGSATRIILSEQAVKLLTVNEIAAIVAHEAAHGKRNHLFELALSNLIQLGLLLLILWLSLSQPFLQQAFGPVDYSLHLGLFVFVLLYSPATLAINALINRLSRHLERQADDGVKEVGLAAELISALKKLAAQELKNMTPHPAYVAFYYAHPTLADRIERLNNSA